MGWLVAQGEGPRGRVRGRPGLDAAEIVECVRHLPRALVAGAGSDARAALASDGPSQTPPPAASRAGQAPPSTDVASSAGVPPDAISWLSWYWANSASASRWASSNARRRSRSRSSSRVEQLGESGVGVASTIAERPSSRTHDTAPGSRWPTDAVPGAARGRAGRRAGASSACPRSGHDRGRARRSAATRRHATAALKDSAAGASVSRIVLSPTAHRPRRASPSAAASSIGASLIGGDSCATARSAPASRNAVP